MQSSEKQVLWICESLDDIANIRFGMCKEGLFVGRYDYVMMYFDSCFGL